LTFPAVESEEPIDETLNCEPPHLGEVFRTLAEQKESRIEEGHLLTDHVQMMIAIPPKYAVSQVPTAFPFRRIVGDRYRDRRRHSSRSARVVGIDACGRQSHIPCRSEADTAYA
jgi:Transposase IS200 like